MDRLIAIVACRWRMDLRRVMGARERALGLLLVVPGLAIAAAVGSVLVFAVLRGLEGAEPALVLPVASAAATGIGLFWAASPLVGGVALSEAADVSRLMHFPIPLPVLALSSLAANLTQPAALAQAPILIAAAAALSGSAASFLAALVGVTLTFVLILASAQVAGLALHGLSRHRRLHDAFLFVGLGSGLLLSLAPLLLLTGGPAGFGAVLGFLSGADVFAFSPYAWGVRSAIHAGRGEALPALALAVMAAVAIVVALAASGALVQSIERGPLDLGVEGHARSRRPSRLRLPGAVGALVEKDLRLAWRDPGLRAVLVMGLAGPILVVFFLSRGGAASGSGTPALLLASFVGLSSFGGNALGMERRGIGLLLGFPVDRWRILVAKNLATLAFRIPSLVTLGIAAVFLAPLAYTPAAGTIAVVTLLLSAGVDNFMAILFPIPMPGAAANPYGRAATRGRGAGAALVGLLLLASALVLSAPFAFLVWLPLLLGRPLLWSLTLPLALAGAGCVYAMLVAGAAHLMQKREPELLERILVEA